MPLDQTDTCYYPESDGKPIGESDWHIDAIIRIRELLKLFLKGEQAYVGADLLLYYERGNPKKFVVPDVFVTKGISPRKRRIYRLWVEGKAPNVVFEVTSRKTRKKDAVTKPELYAAIGVAEYFVFDPDIDDPELGYLDVALQGYRMSDGHIEPIEPDVDGYLHSEQLGLKLREEDKLLQFIRLDNGCVLQTALELAAEAEDAVYAAREVADEANQRAAANALKLREAEAELARLKAELANAARGS